MLRTAVGAAAAAPSEDCWAWRREAAAAEVEFAAEEEEGRRWLMRCWTMG